MPPSTPVRGAALALMLGVAGCLGAGKGEGEGEGHGGADDGPGLPDTAAVDCAAAPLDCDGEDNDCDGVADEGGEEERRSLTGLDADSDGWAAEAAVFGCPATGRPHRDLTGGGDCADDDPSVSPVTLERCGELIDADCDGLPQCADPDCFGPRCEERCAGGLDEDGDGAVDCDDRECAAAPECNEDCGDLLDDDLDGLTDCADSDCLFDDLCAEDCFDGVDNNADGRLDCADPRCRVYGCPEVCGDGIDNDGNGRADCRDPECAGPSCAEDCADGVDNDGNGAEDCADPSCWGPGCDEDCIDAPHADEDLDGLTNCEDADCAAICVERCGPTDRDEDGLLGCDDPDCALLPRCWAGLSVAADGVRLERELRASGSGARSRLFQRSALSIDHLWLSGAIPGSGSATTGCWVDAAGLTAGISRSLTGTSWSWASVRASAAARALSTAPPPCPSMYVADLWSLYPTPLPDRSATWALQTGDLLPLFAWGPPGDASATHFALRITAVGPYSPEPLGAAPWERQVSQSAWGEIEVVSP